MKKSVIVKKLNELYECNLDASDVEIYNSHLELFSNEILHKASRDELVNILELFLKNNEEDSLLVEDYLLTQCNIYYVEDHWVKDNKKSTNKHNGFAVSSVKQNTLN